MSYKFAPILPKNNEIYQEYTKIKKLFGEDINVYVLGVQDSTFTKKDKLQDWINLGKDIKEIKGVTETLSLPQAFNLKKNTKKKTFELERIFPDTLESQSQVDSLWKKATELQFYKNLLYNPESNTYLMTILFEKGVMVSKDRERIVAEIQTLSDKFSAKHDKKVYHSGIPYIRTLIAQCIREEMGLFISLAAFITAFIMFMFFRSFKVVLISSIIVAIGVVWTFASIVLLDFEISVLTGMIPPILIVIGVPNTIYLLNKFHQEFVSHRNKIKSLQRIIQKVGSATFLTNLTTACGFATFIITDSQVLREFGIIATLNIFVVFFLSLIIIPSIFSFFPDPKERHTKHLRNRKMQRMVDLLVKFTLSHRTEIYILTVILLVSSVIGISKVKHTGYVVEDFPEDDPIRTNLVFFEKHFKGVMPIEVYIDTKKNKGVYRTSVIKKIEKLQNKIAQYPECSRSISICDALKFTKQAFYNGNEKKYSLPDSYEKNFILSYVNKSLGNSSMYKSYLDSLKQKTRICVNVADIGTKGMEKLYKNINKDIKDVFGETKMDIRVSGSNVVIFMGNKYLLKNLFVSIALAILLIAIFMAVMFSSWRMILASLVPNLIPLLFTAALMGFFNIPIKPSTILVFSVAFGISVDDTIHFLTKYRQELIHFKGDIKTSVLRALQETGYSMIYTSIVLFCGFSIFMLSNFGGSSALGMLVAITLFVAMFSNLMLLPSVLLTLDKFVANKAFKESAKKS